MCLNSDAGRDSEDAVRPLEGLTAVFRSVPRSSHSNVSSAATGVFGSDEVRFSALPCGAAGSCRRGDGVAVVKLSSPQKPVGDIMLGRTGSGPPERSGVFLRRGWRDVVSRTLRFSVLASGVNVIGAMALRLFVRRIPFPRCRTQSVFSNREATLNVLYSYLGDQEMRQESGKLRQNTQYFLAAARRARGRTRNGGWATHG